MVGWDWLLYLRVCYLSVLCIGVVIGWGLISSFDLAASSQQVYLGDTLSLSRFLETYNNDVRHIH